MFLRRIALPSMLFLAALMIFAGSVRVMMSYKVCTANAAATDMVDGYAAKLAKSANAAYSVFARGDQITPSSSVRRRMYDIVFKLDGKTVVRRACITFEMKEGEEKIVQFSTWPEDGNGKVELQKI